MATEKSRQVDQLDLLLVLPGLIVILLTAVHWRDGSPGRMLLAGAAIAAGAPLVRRWLDHAHREAMLREIGSLGSATVAPLDEMLGRLGQDLEEIRGDLVAQAHASWLEEQAKPLKRIEEALKQLKRDRGGHGQSA